MAAREIVKQAILRWTVSLEEKEEGAEPLTFAEERLLCNQIAELRQYIEAGEVILEDFDRHRTAASRLFENYEIARVGDFDDGYGDACTEVITEDGERTEDMYDRIYWTVYGRKSDGCVEALVDRNTEENAQKICDEFTMLLEFFKDYS
jgi:hypothetical protein